VLSLLWSSSSNKVVNFSGCMLFCRIFLLLTHLAPYTVATYCTAVNVFQSITLMVLVSGSWCKASNAPSVRSLAMDEEIMQPSRWFGFFAMKCRLVDRKSP